jgi:hypothetical protein
LRSAIQRPIFAELRNGRRILRIRVCTLFARYDDARKVVSRPRDFSVRLERSERGVLGLEAPEAEAPRELDREMAK